MLLCPRCHISHSPLCIHTSSSVLNQNKSWMTSHLCLTPPLPVEWGKALGGYSVQQFDHVHWPVWMWQPTITITLSPLSHYLPPLPSFSIGHSTAKTEPVHSVLSLLALPSTTPPLPHSFEQLPKPAPPPHSSHPTIISPPFILHTGNYPLQYGFGILVKNPKPPPIIFFSHWPILNFSGILLVFQQVPPSRFIFYLRHIRKLLPKRSFKVLCFTQIYSILSLQEVTHSLLWCIKWHSTIIL